MGKDKHGQRAKGNQKPSSSGRTAELLGGVSGFIGFSSLTDLGYVPAANNGGQQDDSGICAEFRVALRKMSKKDATTKIKALQEFEILCENEDIEAIKTTLPFWPRLYCKLSIDAERRVREATQSAHGALIHQVGKQFAPYLKGIMPAWLLAMCDPHTPAAITATKSFQGAFSDDKRAGVMTFCSKEIFDHISDNLLCQTPETLSDPKLTVSDDMENKYLRVVACSLNGLGLFLQNVTSSLEEKHNISTRLKTLIKEEKFWKLHKHENPLIRSGWFALIKTLFEYNVKVLQEFSSQLSAAMFPAMDDVDPSVLSHIWIAFLHYTVGIPECWNDCSAPRSLFGRIFTVLRDGCRGNALELCPQLLPIISVFPDKILDDRSKFYVDFFRAITAGLRKERVLSCRRDLSAMIKALFECLRFVSKENKCEIDVWKTIVKYQVVDLLISSFNESEQLYKSVLYEEVADLLAYWNLWAQEHKHKPLNQLGDLFWKLYLPECWSVVQECQIKPLNRIQTFFVALKDPKIHARSKSTGVKFSEEINIKPVMISIDNEQKTVKDLVNKDIFICCTTKYLSSFISDCYLFYKDNQQPIVYECFSTLLSCYPSKDLFSRLLSEQSSVTPTEIISKLVMPVMEGRERALVPAAVKIFVALYPLLSQENQLSLLSNVQVTMSDYSLKLLVENFVTNGETDSVAATWLQSSGLSHRIVTAIKRLFSTSNEEDFEKQDLTQLVKFVLNNANQKEPIFATECLQQIISEVQNNFPSSCISTHEDRLLLLCELTSHMLEYPPPDTILGVQHLLYQLFLPLCQPLHILKEITRHNVMSTFIHTLRKFLQTTPNTSELLKEGQFLNKLLVEIKQSILHPSCPFVSAKFITELALNMLREFASHYGTSDLLLDCDFVQKAFEILMPSEGEWIQLENDMSPLYLAPDILQGCITFSEFLLPLNMQEPPKCTQDYARICMVLTNLLSGLCKTKEVSEDPLEQVSLGPYTYMVSHSLHAVCHSTSMLHMNQALNDNSVTDDLKFGTKRLQEDVATLLELINVGNKKLIVKQIKDRCSDGSSFWCVTLKLVLTKWITTNIDAAKLFHGIDDGSLGATTTKQTLLPLLSKDEIDDILAEETAKLASLSDDPFSGISAMTLVTTALCHLDDECSINTITTIFNVLVTWREAVNNIFLFAMNVSSLPWEQVSLMVAIVRLVTVVVKNHTRHLQHSHWDFVLCSQSAWTQSLLESAKNIDNETVVGMFCCAVCKCIGCVNEVMEKLRTDSAMQEQFPSTLLTEWDEFFAPSVYKTLLPMFIDTTNRYEKSSSVLRYCVLRSICIGVCGTGVQELSTHSLPTILDPADEDGHGTLSEKHQVLLNHLTGLLLSRHPPTQYAAYRLLTTALTPILEEWEASNTSTGDEDNTPPKPLPCAITKLIKKCGGIVEAATVDQEFGISCQVLPYTDAYTYTYAYLLGWSLIHTAITLVPDTSQHQYSAFLTEKELHQNLLINLFKLMPQKPVFTISSEKSNNAETTMFNSSLTVNPTMSVSSDMMWWQSCQVYKNTLTHLPAAVRLWWTNLDRHTQQIVNKYTQTYVSPLLIQQELAFVNSSLIKFDNMTIKTRPGAREVVATYTIDEASMELVLRLSLNHPLTTILVEDHKRVGVSVAEWRNSLFGLNIQLVHRNTPLLQSLAFWKSNIDKKFEGVEECYICYYVLHGSNHQLPKLLCRTCKKKFHSACLYKWINTSNNSTCPLCRSLF